MMKAQSLETEGFSLNPGSVTYCLSVLNIFVPQFLHVGDEDNTVPISWHYSEGGIRE